MFTRTNELIYTVIKIIVSDKTFIKEYIYRLNNCFSIIKTIIIILNTDKYHIVQFQRFVTSLHGSINIKF